MERPPFFTWIDETYALKSDVPERLHQEMRLLTYFGATPEELSVIFNMPVEWVEDFVRDAPRKTSPLN
jgi:hypothetical protein